jgi:glycine/D-amino acid oxidase-like deaminating enzyme
MTTTVDVAIVGGGVMGSAIALFLAADPAFDGRVIVIERDPGYRRASSALSASSIRQQFSTVENIRMSQYGFAYLEAIDEHLAVTDGDRPSQAIGLHRGGYLYLASRDRLEDLRANHAVQTAAGADVILLGPADLEARFPWLSLDGVELGSLGLHGEGWFDGYGLLMAFRRTARSLDVEYVAAEVVGLDVTAGQATGLRLADGTTISCGTVVDAAGPWAAGVAAMAGVDLPVAARRRTVFAFTSPTTLRDCPLVIDTTGAWFRPEGDGYIGAIAPPPADDLDDLPLEVDRRLFDERLWPALAARVPAFDAIRTTNAWAGYYEVNTYDHNAILGPHPDLTNLLFATGFSGHGIQHAPAVGRAIAELVVHGRYVSLDLSVFGFERIAAGRRVVERNIIG